MADYQPIPIGYENFKRVIDEGFYYVDKTLFIQELIDKHGMVNLFTRPRRFGKTLNLSMLRYYFEKTEEDNSYLFEQLKISKAGEKYRAYMGQYPVISLSLKSMKQPNYAHAFLEYKNQIMDEYKRHKNVLDGDNLSDSEKVRFEAIRDGAAEDAVYFTAIRYLADCLKLVYGRNVIILIDEYDVPLENAYFRGFYDEMVDLIRSAFESALKTNDSLEFAVITGCLRISKESIFTGLNNLKVISILNHEFGEYYGFVQEEVDELLKAYGLLEVRDMVKQWYDGYRFGTAEVYNPWSVINFVDDAKGRMKDTLFPRPFWANTSSNSIVKELVEHADMELRSKIEGLIDGETIEVAVHEDITYDTVYSSDENLWNFLFFTGYLKMIEQQMRNETIYMTLMIPNAEVRSIYKETVLGWFDRKMKTVDMTPLFQALENGDCETLSNWISDQLLETISFYDYHENYYHGFMTGLLKNSTKYLVQSNMESGIGRADIIMKTPSRRGGAIVFELKVADSFMQLEEKCEQALAQIEEKQYETLLRAEGYQNIQKYGISFYKKDCAVKREKE